MTDKAKDKKTIVYLTQLQRESLEDEAFRLYREGEHNRQSISEVVRRAIDSYLEGLE